MCGCTPADLACLTRVTSSFSVVCGRSVVFSTLATAVVSCEPQLPSVTQVSSTMSEARGASTPRARR